MSGPRVSGRLKTDLYGNRFLVDPYYDTPIARIEDTLYGPRLRRL